MAHKFGHYAQREVSPEGPPLHPSALRDDDRPIGKRGGSIKRHGNAVQQHSSRACLSAVKRASLKHRAAIRPRSATTTALRRHALPVIEDSIGAVACVDGHVGVDEKGRVGDVSQSRLRSGTSMGSRFSTTAAFGMRRSAATASRTETGQQHAGAGPRCV